MNDLLGGQGLVINGAAAVWLAVGVWRFAVLVFEKRNGKNGRNAEPVVNYEALTLAFADRLAISQRDLIAEIRSAKADMIESSRAGQHALRNELEAFCERIDDVASGIQTHHAKLEEVKTEVLRGK